MENVARYFDADGAADELRRLALQLGVTDFARVTNLDYAYSPAELYPLAPRAPLPLERIVAFLLDMDGTSTTTEPLALHALEYMVRRFTGRLTPDDWPGLDPKRDHPHVIGNSNFRHTEFLVERYEKHLDAAAFRQAFFEALCWTLANMQDPQRRRDVAHDARTCGLGCLLEDADFKSLASGSGVSRDRLSALVAPLLKRHGSRFRCSHRGQLVAAALDIYYMRYHSILQSIERGHGKEPSGQLLGQDAGRLIEPMPGYELFVSLAKGWLGGQAEALYELLREDLRRIAPDAAPGSDSPQRARFVRLAEHFSRHPARLALVTASISYEAHASMKEVMAIAREHVHSWPLAAEHRDRIAENMADYCAVFDAFIHAGDACEHRLKPHRDLYSLALHQMSISRSDYACCVGLEDTEPGIIALRAAGVGCAVALPNRDTGRQDYSAATVTLHGGLPELILAHNLLLADAP